MTVMDTYRLPRHARPKRYDLELRPDLHAARFEGHVGIDLEVDEASNRLVLHAVDLDLGQVVLEGTDGASLTPSVSLDEADQMLMLDFDRELAPGPYRLSIAYSGVLTDQLRGFYRSTFRDHEGNERVIATTQFEATDARRAFPCWDEPDFKAVFQITLVVDPDLAALSNAPLESARRRDDGRIEMRFAETMVMSTYLVAFVIGPYELTEPDVVDGIPVRVAALAGKLDLTPYAMEVARHSLRFLSSYFGIPYPGGKLDHVAVPDFAFGAMENLGCVTYRDNLLLVDPDTSAQTELQRVATVVAHETAHMWFGDLVTMKWWNGIWLNEAFATFMEVTTSDDFHPEWQVWTAFGAGRAAALSTDGLAATRPVEFPVGRPEEAEAMFDVLTYQKGGSVLKMLEQYLGPEVFRQGISHYLSIHAYGNTDTPDLWDAIEEVSGEPVRTIMDSWIRQGGYPLVRATLGEDGSSVVLRQRRFAYDASRLDEEEAAQRWAVPVNLRASVGGEVRHDRLLLSGEEDAYRVAGPLDWVLVNDGAWGYYRVRYSPDLWHRLAEASPASLLDPVERLQLLGDTWAAVVAGEAELGEWAAAAAALTGDADPDVWGSAAGVLGALDLIAGDEDREALARFAGRLARPAWEQVGWDPRPGEDKRTATARGRLLGVLAQRAGDGALAAEATRRLSAHIAASASPTDAHPVPAPVAAGGAALLSPDLIGAAARVTVASGGAAGWELVLAAFRQAEHPQDKLRYLFALAETPVPELRMRTLDLALGPEVRSHDGPTLIGTTLLQPGAAGPGWEWVEGHWAEIVPRFPTSLLPRLLEGTAYFLDEALARRVREFCATVEPPVTAIRLAQILERMDVNVALGRRLRGTMARALG